jgi:hypothetical protein
MKMHEFRWEIAMDFMEYLVAHTRPRSHTGVAGSRKHREWTWWLYAGVVELVDALDSKSSSERSAGSTPATRTTS